MIEDRISYGKQLKNLIKNEVDVAEIGRWSHSVYIDLPSCEDSKFLKLLIHLGTMELGDQFEFSYEELDKIADDLIAGKDVVL